MKNVYLSGPISGMTYEVGNSWREYVAFHLNSDHVNCLNPMRAHEFLQGHGIIGDKHLQEGHKLSFLVSDEFIATRDAMDTMKSDVCFVNLLGAERFSTGTILEIGMAHASRVPIVLVMETVGNVHDHAMVRNFATLRFDNLQNAVVATRALLMP